MSSQSEPLKPPNASLVGTQGRCVLRLLQYTEDQRRRPPDNNIEYWKKFVAEYFSENGTMKIDVCRTHYETRSFEPCIEALPRLFKVKYDSGVKMELLFLENPREYILQNGFLLLDCPSASIVSVFEESQVWNYGHLRVIFTSNLKILCWEFFSRSHQEMLPRTLYMRPEAMPTSPVNEFGLTPEYSRCLLIAEVVHDMKDLIAFSAASGLGLGQNSKPNT